MKKLILLIMVLLVSCGTEDGLTVTDNGFIANHLDDDTITIESVVNDSDTVITHKVYDTVYVTQEGDTIVKYIIPEEIDTIEVEDLVDGDTVDNPNKIIVEVKPKEDSLKTLISKLDGNKFVADSNRLINYSTEVIYGLDEIAMFKDGLDIQFILEGFSNLYGNDTIDTHVTKYSILLDIRYDVSWGDTTVILNLTSKSYKYNLESSKLLR